MARSRVAFSVGTVALICAFLGMAEPLEAQGTGVLQATARVTDYRSSLVALNAARAASVSSQEGAVSNPAGNSRGRFQVVTTEAVRREAATSAKQLVVTISYLD